jgi:sialic acid synthase SpsE
MTRTFIIAEAGSNWRMGTPKRDLEMAQRLIDAAVDAGADAVKFQTYRPETVYVENAGVSEYMASVGTAENIRDVFADLSMPYVMVPELHAYCQRRGIQFLSTPFSEQDFAAVDPYVARHKIASYEITHLRLLELAARSRKPLILSTGAADEDEITWAIDIFRKNGGRELTLMQCTLAYPVPPHDAHLRVLTRLQERFGLPVGFSDHTRHPIYGPVAAVALGARVIEKHYTLHNQLPGPDHGFAITTFELKEMVQAIRATEQLLGHGVKEIAQAEQAMHRFGQRRLQATRPIAVGDRLREGENVAILRSGNQTKGIHPKYLVELEGKCATRNIPLGSGIQQADWADG